jgi:hypothetical protein
LPFGVYEALLDSLVDPRKFILNYSGPGNRRAAAASSRAICARSYGEDSMQITIDTEAGLLRLNRDGGAVEHSLFSREAFRIYRSSGSFWDGTWATGPEPLFAADYDFTGLSYFPATWLKRRET